MTYLFARGFPGGVVAKSPPANAGDTGDASSIPGSGRSPGVGNDNPLQYSCLENSMDRGASWATVHQVAKSRLSTHRHKFAAFFCFCFSFSVCAKSDNLFFLWHNIINVFFHFYLQCIRNCARPYRCLRWASNTKGYFQSRETGYR